MSEGSETSSKKKCLRALVLDDDQADITLLKRHLAKLPNYKISTREAATEQDALTLLETEDFDVVFTDYRLTDRTSVNFIGATGGRLAGAPVILVSGMPGHIVRKDGYPAGASAYLSKDELSANLIEAAVETAMHSVEVENELMREIKANAFHASNTERLLDLCSVVEEFLGTLSSREKAGTDEGFPIKYHIAELQEFVTYCQDALRSGAKDDTDELLFSVEADEARKHIIDVLYHTTFFLFADEHAHSQMTKRSFVYGQVLNLSIFTKRCELNVSHRKELNILSSHVEKLGGTLQIEQEDTGSTLNFFIPIPNERVA